MNVSYDPAKNARNIATRGISFDSAVDFDFSTALIEIDDRNEYGETGSKADMSAHKSSLIGSDGEVREITREDLKSFRPATEALPTSLQIKLGVQRRGHQRSPIKERITIRLSPEVVESFRASGPGWQGRMDDALRDWLKEHEPA